MFVVFGDMRYFVADIATISLLTMAMRAAGSHSGCCLYCLPIDG